MAVGVVNSFVIVKLGVNSFIATLGMSSILSAMLVIVSSNSQPLPPTSTAWNNFTQTTVAGFQIVVLYLIILGFILWWLLAHTPVGRYFYAVGGNTEAARLSGVRINRWSTVSLLISGTIAGLAGVMFSSLNGPSLNFGPTLLLPAFAAAFLGSTQLTPGRFNVWGTLLAIYVLATGVQGLQLVSGASLAQRHVQRRRPDRRGCAVDQALPVGPGAAACQSQDCGEAARRRREASPGPPDPENLTRRRSLRPAPPRRHETGSGPS